MGLHVQALFLSGIRKQQVKVSVAQEFVFLWQADVTWWFCEAYKAAKLYRTKDALLGYLQQLYVRHWSSVLSSFEANVSQPVVKK